MYFTQSTLHCTVPSVEYRVYTVHCTLYSSSDPDYPIRCKLTALFVGELWTVGESEGFPTGLVNPKDSQIMPYPIKLRNALTAKRFGCMWLLKKS